MRLQALFAAICCSLHWAVGQVSHNSSISMSLFSDLEELSRISDISYCTLLFTSGISRPFNCWSRCSGFPSFELIMDWRTGMSWRSDGGGYLALDHARERILVVFRGTINVAGVVADLRLRPERYTPLSGTECEHCTVHTGFYRAWNETRPHVVDAVKEQVDIHSGYELHLVGHSLGAAVAAFAALDFNARGWEPFITTFGEPRVGNVAMNKHIDEVFGLKQEAATGAFRWRRVTHTNDPIPLLPPTEWGYAMHAGEIHISKPSLSPSVSDLKLCSGAFDKECIAGEDPTYPDKLGRSVLKQKGLWGALKEDVPELLGSVWRWDLPHRFRIWELLVAHRDYFWRLGICVPGGDPTGGGGGFAELEEWKAEQGRRQGKGAVEEGLREVQDEVCNEVKDEL